MWFITMDCTQQTENKTKINRFQVFFMENDASHVIWTNSDCSNQAQFTATAAAKALWELFHLIFSILHIHSCSTPRRCSFEKNNGGWGIRTRRITIEFWHDDSDLFIYPHRGCHSCNTVTHTLVNCTTSPALKCPRFQARQDKMKKKGRGH